MAIKKPYTIRALTDKEVPNINQDFDILYSHKLESRWKNEFSSTALESNLYQVVEYGEVAFSANGSAITTRTFSLAETHGRIIYANAHARFRGAIATVTDVTGTAITIDCAAMTATNNLSALTTATIRVFYQVVGSS